MPLMGADSFTGIISSYRLLWVGGRFGGHKTSLSIKLAQPFLEQGYRLVTNTRCVWADSLEDIKLDPVTGHLKAVVILDEGGLEIKANRQIEEMCAYANKMDIIYIFPSFFPPTRAAQVLNVQALFSLKSAGLPVVVYKWRVHLGGFDDKGFFLWSFPDEIYGTYSRQDPGAKSNKIVSWLLQKKDEYRKHFGHDDYGTENGVSEVEESASSFDLLTDAAASFAETADTLSSVSLRKNRRRGL